MGNHYARSYGYKGFIIADFNIPNDDNTYYYCWEQHRDHECDTCDMTLGLGDRTNKDLYIHYDLLELLRMSLIPSDIKRLIAHYAYHKLTP